MAVGARREGPELINLLVTQIHEPMTSLILRHALTCLTETLSGNYTSFLVRTYYVVSNSGRVGSQ